MLLRRLERWLHQHIFKVGWLLTHSFQTTTILYYTFFLPGVFVHELIYWLAAGILNIRADRAIQMPEAQEVGELKLNFIKLSSRADIYRKAIITAIPLLAGMLIIWFAAHNIFNLDIAFETMSTGELTDISAGLQQLTTAPDFWLWFYLVFTIANTMYPANAADLKAWRNIGAILGVLAIIGFIIVPSGTLIENILIPLGTFFSEIQGVLLLIIGINIFMVVFLGFIEYVIEAVSGHSVTFRKGKMITMTRAEAQEARQQEREKAARKQARQRKASAKTTLKTVYALEFPVPDVPGKEPVTQPDEAPRQPVLIAGGEVQDDVSLPEISEPEARREPVFNPASRKPDSVPEASAPEIEEEEDIESAVDDAIRIAQFNNQQRDIAPEIEDEPDTLDTDISETLSSVDNAPVEERLSLRPSPFVNKSPAIDEVADDIEASEEADSQGDSIPTAPPVARKSVPLQAPITEKPDDAEDLIDDIESASVVKDSVAENTGNDVADEPDDKPAPAPLPVEIPGKIDLSSLRDSLTTPEPDKEKASTERESTETTEDDISLPAARISPFARQPMPDDTVVSKSDAEELKPATPKGTLRQSPLSASTGGSLLRPRPFKPVSSPSETEKVEKSDEGDLSDMFKPATPKGTLRRPAAGLRPFSATTDDDETDTDTPTTPKSSLRTGLSSFNRNPAPDIFNQDSLRASFSSDDDDDFEEDTLEYEDYDDVYYDDEDDEYGDYGDDDDITFYDDDD
ncbi:MAG: hypothetical protein ACPG7F_06700 [Aggregatilineales bacterium]